MIFQITVTAILLSLLSTAYSQKDSLTMQTDSLNKGFVNPFEYPDTWLYRWSGPRFAKSESSIGIMPSIQGVDNLFLGLGLSKARFGLGEGGGNGFGTTIGIDYNPIDRIIAPKINLWATGFAFFFGGNVGISGLYYIKDQESNFVLRPEIGIGYLKVFVNYGYNLFLRNDFEGISKHTITLSYYHTFLPFKKKRKAPNKK